MITERARRFITGIWSTTGAGMGTGAFIGLMNRAEKNCTAGKEASTFMQALPCHGSSSTYTTPPTIFHCSSTPPTLPGCSAGEQILVQDYFNRVRGDPDFFFNQAIIWGGIAGFSLAILVALSLWLYSNMSRNGETVQRVPSPLASDPDEVFEVSNPLRS